MRFSRCISFVTNDLYWCCRLALIHFVCLDMKCWCYPCSTWTSFSCNINYIYLFIHYSSYGNPCNGIYGAVYGASTVYQCVALLSNTDFNNNKFKEPRIRQNLIKELQYLPRILKLLVLLRLLHFMRKCQTI